MVDKLREIHGIIISCRFGKDEKVPLSEEFVSLRSSFSPALNQSYSLLTITPDSYQKASNGDKG